MLKQMNQTNLLHTLTYTNFEGDYSSVPFWIPVDYHNNITFEALSSKPKKGKDYENKIK